MKEYLERLVESRAHAWEQAKALLDTADADKRELSAEERQTFDRINTDLDAKDAEIRHLTDLAERNAKADELRSAAARIVVPSRPSAEDPSDADILRSVLSGEMRSTEFRSLTKGTASAGGVTVDPSFVNQLWENMVWDSAVLSLEPTVYRTATGDDLNIPAATNGAVSGITAEAAAIGSNDPSFALVSLKAYKYGRLTQVALELVNDTDANLIDYVARDGARGVMNGLGVHLFAGTGTGQPKGISNFAAGPAAAAVGTSVAIDLLYSVQPQYRRNGKFLLSDTAIAALRKEKSTTGDYIWAPSLVAGAPDTILGKPVLSDPNFATSGTTNPWGFFGDFTQGYAVRLVRDVQVASSTDFAFDKDLVTYKVTVRADANIVDANAVRHVKYNA